MNERPIPFSGPMVRAILDGSKTQTRRMVKDAPVERDGYLCTRLITFANEKQVKGIMPSLCPYGKPGDRLWVREAWRPYSWNPYPTTVQYRSGNVIGDVELPDSNEAEAWADRVIEQCSTECANANCDEDGDGNYTWDGDESCPIRWRPSIHMPRWASRITLEVTEVRVQRLQEISFEDCLAEGVISTDAWTSEETASRFHSIAGRGLNVDGLADVNQLELQEMMIDCGWQDYARAAFATLWESINGPGTWDANPWVWAVTFKRVEQESAAEKGRAL